MHFTYENEFGDEIREHVPRDLQGPLAKLQNDRKPKRHRTAEDAERASVEKRRQAWLAKQKRSRVSRWAIPAPVVRRYGLI